MEKNLPLSPSVRRVVAGLVGRLVCHIIIKGRKVSLPKATIGALGHYMLAGWIILLYDM